MEKDVITIIIPVYNVEAYLEKCITSVINQTYKNLEIIIVNDGSTDNSLSICKKFEKKDKRIRLVNKENGGVSSARNCGLDICSGSYVTFIDADDYVEKDYIETLYKKLKEYDVDIVFSNVINVRNNKQDYSFKKNKRDTVLDKDNLIKEILKEEIVNSISCGNLYNFNVIKDIRFDTKMRISEDMKFLFEIIKNVSSSLIIADEKYYYVYRNDSASHCGFNDKWYDEINYCRDLIDNYKDTEIEEYAVKRYVRVITYCMYCFKINKKKYRNLKSLIKPYFFRYLFSNIVSLKLKIMYLIVLLK